jgi:hypothetical protein
VPTQPSSLVTVATRDYLPQAITTLRSAHSRGTYSSFHLFVVDVRAAAFEALRAAIDTVAPWIRIFGPDDLGPRRDMFLAAFEQFMPLELCCFAKYVGISHVLNEPGAADICVFADGDMLFMRDTHDAVDAMGDCAVLVTPHLLRPSTDCVEHDIMTHGWMNAGFVAFRRNHPETQTILEWLLDRISRRGFLAPQYGLSLDQKWVSALPVLFRDATSVSAHPGLNVGYWNVAERPLAGSGTSMLAGGSPLLVFHFSGFDWPRSRRLSKQSDYVVTPGSPLEELVQIYDSELQSVAGLREAIQGLEVVPCSSADVAERVRIGSARYGINLFMPTLRPGLFSRMGAKIDSLARRTMDWSTR